MADAKNTGQTVSDANPFAHLEPWEVAHQLYGIAYQVKAATLMFYDAFPDYVKSDHGTGVDYLLAGVAKQLDALALELDQVEIKKAAAAKMDAAMQLLRMTVNA